MNIWDAYAQIVNGKIENLIIANAGDYTTAALVTKRTYGQDAEVVCVTQYRVEIGDAYKDGNFYHNNKIVMPDPTIEEKIDNNSMDITVLQMLVMDLYEKVGENDAE